MVIHVVNDNTLAATLFCYCTRQDNVARIISVLLFSAFHVDSSDPRCGAVCEDAEQVIGLHLPEPSYAARLDDSEMKTHRHPSNRHLQGGLESVFRKSAGVGGIPV